MLSVLRSGQLSRPGPSSVTRASLCPRNRRVHIAFAPPRALRLACMCRAERPGARECRRLPVPNVPACSRRHRRSGNCVAVAARACISEVREGCGLDERERARERHCPRRMCQRCSSRVRANRGPRFRLQRRRGSTVREGGAAGASSGGAPKEASSDCLRVYR
jgi:hypothetical protein